MLTQPLVRPTWISSVDSDSAPRPGLGQMYSVATHLNFNHTLGGGQCRLLPSPSHVLRIGNSFKI